MLLYVSEILQIDLSMRQSLIHHRIAEKQRYLLELQKELSSREDVVDETLERARQLQDRVVKMRKDAEAEMTNTETVVDDMVDLLVD